MFNKGTNVYYFDLNDSNLIQGVIKDSALINSTIDIDKSFFDVIIENERIGLTEEEAYQKFKEWKIKYKNKLSQDNNWLKELFESWIYNDEYGDMPKEIIKIMKDIIKDKTGIEIEE